MSTAVDPWPLVPLQELLTQAVDGHQVHVEESYPNFGIFSFGRGLFGKQPILGVSTSARTLFRAKKGQFIYSRLFAFEGAYGLVTDEFDGYFVSNEYPMFDCNLERLLPAFLAWYFRWPAVWRQVGQLSTGLGDRRTRVQPEQLLTHHLGLPPLSEQQRLVDLINAMVSRLDEARRLRKEAAEASPTLIQAARRSHIGEDPASSWRPLNTWVKEIVNGWSPACENRPATNGEWGVLKVGAVSFGRFDARENKALPPSLEPLPEYEIRRGDFLMSRANTVELVGACAIVEETPPRLILCDKIFRFVFREAAQVVPRYLEHVLKSPALRKQIERGASGTSPTMKNISKDKVMGLLVPQPPVDEQRRVVALLDDIDARVQQLHRHQSQTSLELKALLPSLLNRAFRGDL